MMIMNKSIPDAKHKSLVKNTKIDPESGQATRRVSKQQWLDAALEVLASDGVHGIRVVSLARTLNISKSGFYWHFKNRDDLLEEMKKYWTGRYSEQIILEVSSLNSLPAEKLLRAVQEIRGQQSARYDLAFALWAKHEPSVRKLVDQMRDSRIAFIKGILVDAGYTGKELEARSRLFIVYFSWSEVMYHQTATGLEGEPLEKIVEIICGSGNGQS
jgi:AcrR family transcriptional regulator